MNKKIAELEEKLKGERKETPVWKKVPLKDDWYALEALEDFSVQGHSVKKGEQSGRIHNTSTIGEYSWVTSDSEIGDDCEIASNVLITEDSSVRNTKILYIGSRVQHSCVLYSQFDGELMAYHSEISSTTVPGGGDLVAEKSTVINSVMTGLVKLESCTLRDVTVAPIGDNSITLSNAQLKYTIVGRPSDVIVFKNWWSSGRYFTYARYTNMWSVGCFYGTGEELIRKAYKDSKASGREYERIVNMVEAGRREFVVYQNDYMNCGDKCYNRALEPCGEREYAEEARNDACPDECCGTTANCQGVGA